MSNRRNSTRPTPTLPVIPTSRLITDYLGATPRLDQLSEEEQQVKDSILEALHSSREDINTEFVVEGATVVCTQMTEGAPIPQRQPSPSEMTSNSKMQVLDPETKEVRSRAIATANPERSVLPVKGPMMQGARILDHMDIEFSPLFGDDPEEEDEPLSPLESLLQSRGVSGRSTVSTPFPSFRSSLLDSLTEDSDEPTAGGCNGCKAAGDCEPDIEQLMWLGCEDNGVNVTGNNTLLKNTAYMFCHTGQGVLYIEESGQHLPDVVDVLEESEAREENAGLNVDDYGRMVMSNVGRRMLMNFELTADYARGRGIGQFDNQGNLIGVYPHYVITVRNGVLVSDGAITLGYGIAIFPHHVDQNDSVNYNPEFAELYNTYAPGAPFTTANTSATHAVPGSSPVSMEKLQPLFTNRLQRYENALNNFLEDINVQLEDYQFDVFASFTFNMGTETWTLPDRQDWYINQLLRNGPPFDPDEVRRAFQAFINTGENVNRRARERDILIDGGH